MRRRRRSGSRRVAADQPWRSGSGRRIVRRGHRASRLPTHARRGSRPPVWSAAPMLGTCPGRHRLSRHSSLPVQPAGKRCCCSVTLSVPNCSVTLSVSRHEGDDHDDESRTAADVGTDEGDGRRGELAEAADLLGLAQRSVWRLKRRFGEEGPAALVHGNRGRASPRVPKCPHGRPGAARRTEMSAPRTNRDAALLCGRFFVREGAPTPAIAVVMRFARSALRTIKRK